jgi:hypothetical protein
MSKAPRRAAVTTTRSTSGEGYDFEDLVSAWLLVKMLTGEPVPGPQSLGTGIKNQTEALGWKVDDLLVETLGAPLAVSCKGNVQVSANGLPKDFVERAWSQTHADEPAEGRRAFFALATRGSHAGFEATWADIRNWATGSDDELTLARIGKSPKHARVFSSVAAPDGVERDHRMALTLARRIDVHSFDFQLATSADEAAAIQQCRQVLSDGGQEEAAQLWNVLVDRAHESRVGGGAIVLTELWGELRASFGLKDHPDFGREWRALQEFTVDRLESVATALPGGVALDRARLSAEIATAISGDEPVLVAGESGVGKSALVKKALEQHHPHRVVVWLGPEDLEKMLSALGRSELGLRHPLAQTLLWAGSADVVLVLDAAEKIPEQTANAAANMLAEVAKGPVKVVVVGQAFWASSGGALLAGARAKLVSVGLLEPEEVADALRQSAPVSWMASRQNILPGLRNLRTLGWVMGAAVAPASEANSLASPSSIVDLVFGRWTEGKLALEGLLKKFAVREADFERSFAVSELGSGDLAAYDGASQTFPLRRNKRGRLEFEHDLAADWARFEILKEMEIAGTEWRNHAINPLWHNAIRLAGQWLLREVEDGDSAWDSAVVKLKAGGADLALDLMLDALFTDPEAGVLLEQKVELLLADGSQLLRRLLMRFRHVGTIPNVQSDVEMDETFRLHYETEFRRPVIAYWPALLRFLHKHRNRVAEWAGAELARIASIWLTATPRPTDSQRIILRTEAAEIALACGRSAQLDIIKNGYRYGRNDQPLFAAVLLGADDIPDPIMEWALEMAHRRPPPQSVTDAARAFHEQQARERAARKEASAMRSRASMPISIFEPEELPPWPLGPNDRVELGFRNAVLNSGSVAALMRTRPVSAIEVVLACLIEGNPVEDRHGLSDGYGLEPDSDTSPAAFWKGPFFVTLQVDATRALDGLIKVVNFCTERWQEAVGGQSPPLLELELVDGRRRTFVGNSMVFAWDRMSSLHSSQLGCALMALEKWLMLEIDRGASIDRYLTKILEEANSLSLLGVLVNIGKYRPCLLDGVLRPLLKSREMYQQDDHRVRQGEFFDAMGWARSGDTIFEMAKAFIFAPHRKLLLRRLAAARIREDPDLAEEIAEATRRWLVVGEEKDDLEREALMAELNPSNYNGGPGDAEREGVEFSYPAELWSRIGQYKRRVDGDMSLSLFPFRCLDALGSAGELTDDGAAYLAEVLEANRDKIDQVEEGKAVLAAAAMLLARSPGWLAGHPAVEASAIEIVGLAMDEIAESDDDADGRPRLYGDHSLEVCVHAIVQRMISHGIEEKWDRMAMTLLTGPRHPAATTLMAEAHRRKSELGSVWPRLVLLGVMSAGLSVFAPRFPRDEAARRVWAGRRAWLRSRSLRGSDLTIERIDIPAIAERVGRVERQRAIARAKGDEEEFGGRYDIPHRAIGLAVYRLEALFAWLVRSEGPLDADEVRFLGSMWKFQAWRAYGQSDDEEHPQSRERMIEQFGYDTLKRIAGLLPTLPLGAARDLWEPVLRLGSKAHYAVRHFISCWTILLSKDVDTDVFLKLWRSMIEYALAAPGWTEGRQWYYGEDMLRELMGIGGVGLQYYPEAPRMVERMEELYRRWAIEHLGRDEDNIEGFCYFLSEPQGASLRLKALPSIAAALEEGTRSSHWHREGTGSALLHYLDVLISRDGAAIAADANHRTLAMKLAGQMAAKQVSGAMTLHDRFARLR